MKAFILLATLIGLLILLLLWAKKLADALAEERRQQNETISQQARELKRTNLQLAESLDHLQQTQQQLILQEKMASLGQMTAGIAHEIKNPLNFVNNFAEGVDEIITEFEEDLSQYQQSQDPADFQLLVNTLADLRKYNGDILEHGRRADQIVNSMMDHANNKKGEKSPTDLNHLIISNLDLARHGYLPQQECFLLEISQDLDPAIPEVTLNPQELGRVLINLVNNACHALEAKKASLGEGFQPTIHLSSRLLDGKVEIRVRDNGPGIPEEIRDQIFQPFFTTKPTGTGNTGLGLSISYDILRQGLQGQLAVESEAGEFTEFILSFPIK